MDSPAAARARHTKALAPLVVVFLATGFATALVGPFLTLFLTTAAHASALQVSVFLVAQPVCGVAASSVMARLSDSRFQRRHVLMVAAIGASAAAASFAVVRTFWVLLLIACTVNALAGAVMPQSFAYAHTVLDGDAAAPMLMSTLRTFFSVAWVAGPPLAAVLLVAGGFGSLFTSAALLYVVVAAVAAFWLAGSRGAGHGAAAKDPAAAQPVNAGRRQLWLTLAGLVVIMSSMSLNVQAMALHIRDDLHGGVRDAGLVLGLCAALEIPAMLGFGALSRRVPLRTLVRLGPAFGATYFVLAATATRVWQLEAAQVLNACYIAIIGGLAISYVQQLLPSQPGRASTLYSNTFPCGALLSGPLMGVAVSSGYRMPYVAAAGLAGTGLILLVVGAGRRPQSEVTLARVDRVRTGHPVEEQQPV